MKKNAHLRIDQDTDIDDCETLIARSAEGGDHRLMLATTWRLDSRPGGVAAGAQTIISWAQSQPEGVLIVHSQPAIRKKVIENICGRYHGIVAAMMATRVVEVDETSDVTRDVREQVLNRIAGMDRLDLQAMRRGQALSLFCVDHSSLGFLRPFYHPGAVLGLLGKLPLGANVCDTLL